MNTDAATSGLHTLGRSSGSALHLGIYLHSRDTNPRTPMLRLVLLFMITGICLVASAQYTATVRTSVVIPENAGWRQWSGPYCVLTYPGNWTQEPGGPQGLSALFMSRADSMTVHRDRMEVQVMDSDGRSLEAIASMGAAGLGERLTEVTELTQSGEGDVLQREYSAKMSGTAMRIKQRFHLHGVRVHVLTYMAEPSNYEESLHLADAMFASFTTK